MHQPFDHDVLIYENISVVRTFFDSVKAPYKSAGPFLPGMKDAYVDLASKKAIPPAQAAAISGNATEQTAIYIKQLKRFPYLSEAGYHLPDPVPEERLIPFGDWLEKNNITGLAAGLFNFDHGGNILAQLALYMLRYHNLVTVETPLPGGPGYLRQADLNNQALYDAAYRHLGGTENVFLNADVRSIVRDIRGVEVCLTMQGTQGRPEVLRADQFIMAIPPLVDQLDKFLDLTHDDQKLFRQFNKSYVWNAVVLNSGIPIDTGINMIAPEAPLAVPSVPSTYAFLPSGLEGVHSVFYGSDHFLTNEEVKCRILDDAATVRSALKYNHSYGQQTRLVDFRSHSPFLFTVPPDAVRAGFFDRLEKLQGASRTWWTGQAFQVPISSLIWNFTEHEVLPGVLKALD